MEESVGPIEGAIIAFCKAVFYPVLHPILDPKAEQTAQVYAKGLPAGPG